MLVNGASGAVGSSAVQLAKHLGAHVTAVSSARNRDFVLGLGADEHLDYATAPLTGASPRYDVVFDTVGNLGRQSGRELLTSTGRLILAVASLGDTVAARGNVIAGPIPERTADEAELLALTADGALDAVTTVAGGLRVSATPTPSSTRAARSATSSSSRTPDEAGDLTVAQAASASPQALRRARIPSSPR